MLYVFLNLRGFLLRVLALVCAVKFSNALGVSTMFHKLDNLGLKTAAELAQAFASIPAGVTTLNLRDNSLT